MILDSVRRRWPWARSLFANGAHHRTQLIDKAAFRDSTTAIVRRSETAKTKQLELSLKQTERERNAAIDALEFIDLGDGPR